MDIDGDLVVCGQCNLCKRYCMYSTGLGVCRIPDEGGCAVMLGSDNVPAPQDVKCRLPARLSIAVDPLHYIMSSPNIIHKFCTSLASHCLPSPPDTGLSPHDLAWFLIYPKCSPGSAELPVDALWTPVQGGSIIPALLPSMLVSKSLPILAYPALRLFGAQAHRPPPHLTLASRHPSRSRQSPSCADLQHSA